MNLKNTFLLLALITNLTAWSQSNCADALFSANSLYEAGKIVESINQLEPCLSEIKSKEDLFEAHRLLAIAYFELGNYEAQDRYITKMLLSEPTYQKYPNSDPLAFTRQVAKFNVAPKFTPGLKIGSNVNFIRLKQSYSGLNVPQRYNPTVGYQIGGLVHYSLNQKLDISLSLSYGGTSIVQEIEQKNNWIKTYRENLNFVDLSLSSERHFILGKRQNCFVGLETGILNIINADVSVKSTNFSPESFKVDTKNGLNERNKVQNYGGVKAGVVIPLERGRIEVGLGYKYFFTNTVNADKRMSDTNFIFDTQYINDDISLGLITLDFVFTYPLSYFVWK